MPKSTLNDTFLQLKSSITNTATNCASKVKVRIDLANEEAKQAKRYQQLGERVLSALVEQDFESLKDDAVTVELIGAIQEKKLLIKELEEKLKGG